MSIDTPTADAAAPTPTVACGLCGAAGDDAARDDAARGDAAGDGDARFLATYATDGVAPPALAAADGVLALCGSCSAEVRELTVGWDEIARPPVGSAPSIAEGYRNAASECGFCDAAVDDADPLLGVESWTSQASREGDATDLAHYALCDTCVPIFEEFLDGVADDVR